MELPYVNNELSMFVFLPPQGQLEALEASMTGSKINDWFANRVSTAAEFGSTVSVVLPRFTFTENYDLGGMLIGLGMSDAFSKTLADFSGIVPVTPDGARLYITKVLHKAFISVGETGTEAAAATAVIIGTTMVSISQPVQPETFRADHPFIFVIRENTTNAILFMGRVMDPTTN